MFPDVLLPPSPGEGLNYDIFRRLLQRSFRSSQTAFGCLETIPNCVERSSLFLIPLFLGLLLLPLPGRVVRLMRMLRAEPHTGQLPFFEFFCQNRPVL